ncbi:MAG: peroxide stress protein YaaA [Acidimicrobiales bacterium]
MLSVLSPAKTLDYESPLATRKHSQPEMLDQAAELVDIMRTKSPDDLRSMMGISPDLAELSHERFCDWTQPFTPANARPAILAFNGDVYLGMDAPHEFNERDFTQAQKVVRILSGLYGLLRPLDLMQPYRLEMGTRLRTPYPDLYTFWGHRITDAVAEAAKASPGPSAVINLASVEYAKAIDPDRLGLPVITPSFLDERDGEAKTIAFFAKRARGAMAGWLVTQRVTTLKGIRDFQGLGYRYDAERSTRTHPVFVRPAPAGRAG